MLQMTMQDREGVVPRDKLRTMFERAVVSTDALSRSLTLDFDEPANRYVDDYTQTAFVAYCIGMRCADRIISIPGRSALLEEIEHQGLA